MRIGRRHRAALAIATLGTTLGVAPLQAAQADPSGPVLSTTLPDVVDIDGAAGDIDLTVTDPPVKDAYFRFTMFGTGLDHIRVTDDSGAVIPDAHNEPDHTAATFYIGKADSDHNGVPGTRLTAGTHLRLHLAADYGAGTGVRVETDLMDGATNDYVDNDWNAHTAGYTAFGQASLAGSWTSPGHGSGPGLMFPIHEGVLQPAEMRLTTHMTRRTPPSATHTRWVFSADQLAQGGYTAAQLAKGITVQYSTDNSHYMPSSWTIGADGSLAMDFPSQTWTTQNPADLHEYVRISAAWGLPQHFLRGALQVVDESGRKLTEVPQELRLDRIQVPAFARHSFYGRDADGVLWQYKEGEYPDTGSRYYTPRTRVGGGWQTYDLLTKISTFGVEGNGDLVGRDRAGVLWYYRGSGNGDAPFASRVKVGGGWQVYDTLIGGGDLTGDGKPDLLARDRGGVLWLYKGTGNPADPFATRTRIGGGWNTYNLITGGADVTGDGRPDLLARDRDGVLWLYEGTGNPAAPFATRTKVGGGWNTYTSIVSPGSLDGRDEGSLLARDHDGRLWIYFGKSGFPFQPRVQIGTGWNTYDTII
ncbi:FG-GAP repeat domain-containing protein [Streptomyces sp. NPDC048696]|uniref:FG-GAP repeat domain-containing protein n=1 Tax=Streptomyces sp. NPDC048696 TaxID=3365585 RepID=UPI00371BC755